VWGIRISIREVIYRRLEEFARSKGLSSVGDALVLILLLTLKTILTTLIVFAIVIAEIVFLALVLCPSELGKTRGTPISRERAIGESVEVLLVMLAIAFAGLGIRSYIDKKLKEMVKTQPAPRV
jgi:hypothetical protein